ncbi:hypothetical protein BZL30_4876 [Mycobacterium kansasii]|uniref:Uncharacterized protein n=1 Tax=Mycobacterium kansasii TaxID=1768 RepID=A0A1V3X4N2_MYCKA|nr:hypothetical protein BZL30_4876 [Mycobacterium kansasii]
MDRCGVGPAASVPPLGPHWRQAIRSSIRQFDYSGGSIPVSP